MYIYITKYKEELKKNNIPQLGFGPKFFKMLE